MEARLRSWWQKIRKYRVAIGVIAIVLVIVIALIIAGYWFDWTGFNGYNKVTITHIISSTNAGTVTKTEEYQPGRALWDWLQLLIIPAVLVIGGFWLNQIQRSREERITEKQKETEQEISRDNQMETALQEYINKMSELLLDEELCKPTAKEEARKIARVRTLTVLPRLNGRRKGIVLQFLYEAQLINKGEKVVDLTLADLNGASLYFAALAKTDLSGAILGGADLTNAVLCGAILGADLPPGLHPGWGKFSGATFFQADLSGADLKGATGIVTEELEKQAKSLKGATMPDGTIHL